MGVDEGIKIMKEGDGSAINGLWLGDKGPSTLPGLRREHAELEYVEDELVHE